MTDNTLYIAPNYHETFGISRADMPQIEQKHVKEFLKKHDVSSKIELVNPKTLKPTQGQFNPEKISNMDESGRKMPILVSSDDYVLDGHHRWLANAYNKEPQPIIRLPVDAKTALSWMNSFSKTFSKAIHEDTAPAVSISGAAVDNTIVAIRKERQKSYSKFKMWRRKNAITTANPF